MPATITPLGLLVAPSAQAAPSPLLARDFDYERMDFRSLTSGADSVDAQVQHTLNLVRDSGAAVRSIGLELTDDKLGDGSARSTAAAVRRALEPMRVAGDIRIDAVTVEVDPSTQTSNLVIKYTNLRARPDRNARRANANPHRRVGVR